MNNAVLEARKLTKKYGNREVIHQVDFRIFQGESFGFLGTHGAGKTSLLKMICCNSRITSGELYVFHLDAKRNYDEIKAKIGVSLQENDLEGELNIQENLHLFCKYHRIPKDKIEVKIAKTLKKINLENFRDTLVKDLDIGLRRKLSFAKSLLNKPHLLILDEPTLSLNLQARDQMWSLIQERKDQGETTLIATYSMEEAEALCDRIAILDQGKILDIGAPKELIKKHIGHEIIELDIKPDEIPYYLGRIRESGYTYQVIKNKIKLYIQSDQDGRKIVSHLMGESFVLRKARLDDVFLKLAGYELRELI